MSNNFFRPGSHYFICDVCGQKYHAEEKMRRWDNMIVCPNDFEIRHPQDFLRAREDRQAVSNPRPRPADVFIYVPYSIYVDVDYVAAYYIEEPI